MFKESKEGQTHYKNDNCGEPAHNPLPRSQPQKKIECETHSICNKRLGQKGGKADCCRCVPHSHCGFVSEWEKELADVIYEWAESKYNPDMLKAHNLDVVNYTKIEDLIKSLLTKSYEKGKSETLEKIRQEVEKLQKEDRNSQWKWILQEVIDLITKIQKNDN